ncbi:MAG: MYG1 family protein [Planctomycetaceae bacterium]
MTNFPWMRLPVIRVATHGCPHHLDELVAVSLLRSWAAEHSRSVEVTFLSRAEIAAASSSFDLLVDIGGEWSPEAGRFDHHQGGPAVAGRSAAGLVFDALFAADPRREFLTPVIQHVDELDSGMAQHHAPDASNRAMRLISLSAALKSLGGFRHDVGASHRCLSIIEPLVRSWLDQASGFAHAPTVIATSERIGSTLLLDSDEPYGPGLLKYLATTNLTRVGFPAGPNRYQVVALRDGQGNLMSPFRAADFPTAQFIHAQGFLAVFTDRATAATAMMHMPSS